MKKTNLRLLSMMLGVITLFPGAPVRGESCSEDVKNKTSNIPFGVKVAVGVGVASVLTASAITAGYALAKSKSSSSDKEDNNPQVSSPQDGQRASAGQEDNNQQTSSPRDHQRQALPISVRGYGSGSYPNANFYNTSNLCYWHALLQHLYDIKAFKKFIEEYDENSITDRRTNRRTKKKFLVLRKIFNAMGERIGGVFSQSECEGFARRAFVKEQLAKRNDVLKEQQDISEAFFHYLADIVELFKTWNKGKSNILERSETIPVKDKIELHDLLTEREASIDEKRGKVYTLCERADYRNKLMRRLPVSLFVKINGDTLELLDDVADAYNSLTREQAQFVACSLYQSPSLDLTNALNENSWKLKKKKWESADKANKMLLFKGFLELLPVDEFLTKDGEGNICGLDRERLLNFIQDKDITLDKLREKLEAVQKKADEFSVPFVVGELDALPRNEIEIDVIDDQFSIFVQRSVRDKNKDTRPVDLGEGTVEFKGQKFELTAVTVHSGNGTGGHYYTYKKQGGTWWKYDDLSRGAPARKVNSWGDVKEDSKCKCVMMTFSKQGTNVKGHEYVSGDTTSILRSEPLNIERGYVSRIISKSNSNPKFSKDKFEIVKTGEGTQYPSGIVDRKLLSDKRYGKVAIVDAANTGGLGGGGVDGAIFRAMGGQNVVNDIRAKLPCYGNSDTRIKEGGAIVHGSYKIGEDFSNVRYVVQTVSPKIRSEGDLPLFYSAWYSAVNLGAKLGCNTIFMPGIGMGVFCENKSTEFAKKCAKVAVQAIKDAIEDSKASIKIVIIDHRDERRSAGFFDELERMTNQFDM